LVRVGVLARLPELAIAQWVLSSDKGS